MMQLSPDFIEKVVLLGVTAALTGFVVPLVLKAIDYRRQREEKDIDDEKLKNRTRFEADLSRQEKVIDAQVQLLENLSNLLWEYQLLAIAVSYYHNRRDQSLYTTALAKYEEKSGELLGRIRAEISKSLRLTSADIHNELRALYYQGLLDLDIRLRSLIEGHDDGWRAFNTYAVFEFAGRVDNVLADLAKELRLNGAAIAQEVSGAKHDGSRPD